MFLVRPVSGMQLFLYKMYAVFIQEIHVKKATGCDRLPHRLLRVQIRPHLINLSHENERSTILSEKIIIYTKGYKKTQL